MLTIVQNQLGIDLIGFGSLHPGLPVVAYCLRIDHHEI